MDASRELYRIKKCWNCCRILFYILPWSVAVIALGLLVVDIYFDDIERNVLIKNIVLAKGSPTFEVLTKQISTVAEVHLFNVTNAVDVTKSKSKPILQTLGPYVYRRELKKINVSFTDKCPSKTCLQFSEFGQFFDENKSSRFPEKDIITVPDILHVVRKYNPPLNGIVKGFIEIISKKRTNFDTLPANEFMWGFGDGVLTLAYFMRKIKDNKIGLLRDMNNSLDGPYTINTGESNITKIGQLETFRNMTKLKAWNSKYANMINGTTDIVTAPGLKLGDKRYVFAAGICRSLLFTATETVFSKYIPQFKLLKMTLGREQFQSVEENPYNLAFNAYDNAAGIYPPSGFLSLSQCVDQTYTVPMYASLPYFHLVDNETRNDIIFDSLIEPNLEPYFLVDPKTGLLMEAHIHYQVNIFMSKKKLGLDKDMFIPLAYIKSIIVADKEVTKMLYYSAYELPQILRASLRLCIGLLVIVGMLLFVIAIKPQVR